MALKMFYRGPSSRLETLIEKIQQNKDNNSGIEKLNAVFIYCTNELNYFCGLFYHVSSLVFLKMIYI